MEPSVPETTMNGEESGQPRRERVCALLDASRQSIAALSAAVELASRGQVELVALYVEDQDLLSCAGFPFSREVGGCSGLARPLSTESVVSSLRHQQLRAREALRHAVMGRNIPHSLQVCRGRVVNAALSLAGPGDILVLGKAGLAGQWGVRLGSTSRALLLQARCTVMIWDERQPLEPGPLRLYDNIEPVRRLLPLFSGIERLPRESALALEQRLARVHGGALQLCREALRHLFVQDPELLGRIPVPVIVINDSVSDLAATGS